MSLSFVVAPSNRLSQLLLNHNLPNPVYILEHCENQKNVETKQSIKKTLNSISGVYVCINLVNGKMYVGSASLNSMFRRFRGHLYLAASGSKIVNNSVLKYGLINFAFIVIEIIPATNSAQEKKKVLLSIEQKYIDQLKPDYNILKKAGSVLNLK
uniref:GIY-YIG endonuclease n=1 Tax=Elmerina hispida TaxID=1245649 RepID=UPI00300188A2|nr:GIY-YIG endonuclease [Elmerina hispida]